MSKLSRIRIKYSPMTFIMKRVVVRSEELTNYEMARVKQEHDERITIIIIDNNFHCFNEKFDAKI